MHHACTHKPLTHPSPQPLSTPPHLAHSRLTHCHLREVSFMFSWLLDRRLMFTYGGYLLLRSLLGLHARLAGLLMAPVLPVGDPPFQMPSHSTSQRSQPCSPSRSHPAASAPLSQSAPHLSVVPLAQLLTALSPHLLADSFISAPRALLSAAAVEGAQRRLLPHQPSWGAPGWAPGAGGGRESPWAGGQNAP